MIVKVHALFSRNNLIGSKIISKGSAHLAPDTERVSHTALLINERWVHESTGHGVNVVSYDKWKIKHLQVASVQLESKEYQEIADQFRHIKGRKYDYPGVIFLGICIALSLFGMKLPSFNLLESPKKYFCCEVLGYLTGHYYGMSPPNLILKRLKEKN